MLVHIEVPGIFGNCKLAPGTPLLLPPLPPSLPRDSTATDPRAVPPEAISCSSAAPRVAPELAHRLSSSCWPSPSAPRRRPSRQQLVAVAAAAALPAPLSSRVASTRCLQASRRPSSPLLVPFRACHAASPLPELHPAATMRRRPPAAATAHHTSSESHSMTRSPLRLLISTRMAVVCLSRLRLHWITAALTFCRRQLAPLLL
jgi:hypothetical protein